MKNKIPAIIIGLGLVLGSGYFLAKNIIHIVTSEKTDGIVTFVSVRSGTKGTSLTPTIKFTTPNGQEILFTPQVSSSFSPEVGNKVTVYYDKNNPENAKTTASGRLWFPQIIILGLGILLLMSKPPSKNTEVK